MMCEMSLGTRIWTYIITYGVPTTPGKPGEMTITFQSDKYHGILKYC